jgi:carbonic anhydrase
MGISNICSSLAGGLTIIPGGVKSTVCIMTGGRTLWANFYNAVFLLVFLFLAKDLINMIPLTALAAVVFYIGYKLCAPKVWRHVAHIGSEQLLVFSITVLATLSTDLLIGIFVGMAAKLILSTAFTWAAAQGADSRSFGGRLAQLGRSVGVLFRSPVVRTEMVDGVYHLHFDGPMVCFNALAIQGALADIPDDVRGVHIHLLDGITLIDHTSCDYLLKFVQEFKDSGRGLIEVSGLGRLFMRSHHESCMRVDSARLSSGATRQLLGHLFKTPQRSTAPACAPDDLPHAGAARGRADEPAGAAGAGS